MKKISMKIRKKKDTTPRKSLTTMEEPVKAPYGKNTY